MNRFLKIKNINILILSSFLISGFYSCSDDEPEVSSNIRNYYKGSVIDLQGNPAVGKTVVLKSDFSQFIAEFVTDENGNYEGAGVIYGTNFRMGLKNDGLTTEFAGAIVDVTRNFVTYHLNYSNQFRGEVVEFPDLIYAPISLFNFNVINNSGNALEVNYEFTVANCNKTFEDNIETADSFCYETSSRTLNVSNNLIDFGLYAVLNTNVTISITDGVNQVSQTFFINQLIQDETIIFN